MINYKHMSNRSTILMIIVSLFASLKKNEKLIIVLAYNYVSGVPEQVFNTEKITLFFLYLVSCNKIDYIFNCGNLYFIFCF